MPSNRKVLALFWKHYKPYKWYGLLMLSAPLLNSFYPSICNYAIQLLVDGLLIATSYRELLFPITLFLGAQVGIEVIWCIQRLAQWKAAPYIRRSIALDVYDQVQHHRYAFFQETPRGAIISKVKSILEGYETLWEEIYDRSLVSLLEVLVSLLSLTLISWKITAFLMIWTLVYGLSIYVLYTRMNVFVAAESENKHHFMGAVSDRLMHITTLLSAGARRRELAALRHKFDKRYIPTTLQRYRYKLKVNLAIGMIYLVKFAFITFYIIHLKLQGLVSMGALIFVLNTLFDISNTVWEATSELQYLSLSFTELKNALTILPADLTEREEEQGKPLRISHGDIQWKEISFHYPDCPPLFNGLTLHIQPGEKVGIVGYSGAGKSSLFHLLLRYFPLQKGEIYIDNQEISSLDPASVRSQIALIPQEVTLFHRTLRENICYGKPDASQEEVIQACQRAHIYKEILSLPHQLDTLIGEGGAKLSAGQRQRIAIARAILQESRILLLDEATSSLDSWTERQIQESLAYLMEESHQTIVAIAHRLSTVKQMDRIIVLDQGKIVSQGTHEKLMEEPKGLYKKLWLYQHSM